jgi:hypothetical protein
MLKRSSSILSAFKNIPFSQSFTKTRTYNQQVNNKRTNSMAASRSAEDFIDMAEDLDLTARGGKRGGRGGRSKAEEGVKGEGRGRRAGGSGRGEMNREVAISCCGCWLKTRSRGLCKGRSSCKYSSWANCLMAAAAWPKWISRAEHVSLMNCN